MAEKAVWTVWHCGEQAYPDGEEVYLSPVKLTFSWSECERISKRELPRLAGKEVVLADRDEHDLIMLARKAFEQHQSLSKAHLP